MSISVVTGRVPLSSREELVPKGNVLVGSPMQLLRIDAAECTVGRNTHYYSTARAMIGEGPVSQVGPSESSSRRHREVEEYRRRF